MIAPLWGWSEVARGAALGLAVAAPIGPTAVLCIQRTLADGALAGMATGYGAATTHMIYAAIAATGLAVVVPVLSGAAWVRTVLLIACAAFLLHLAVRTARREIVVLEPTAGLSWHHARLVGSYLLGLSWTLANPVTLISFAALGPGFAGSNLIEVRLLPAFVLAVFLGSASWWTGLAACVAAARGRMNVHLLRVANGVTAGMLLLAASALLMLSGV